MKRLIALLIVTALIGLMVTTLACGGGDYKGANPKEPPGTIEKQPVQPGETPEGTPAEPMPAPAPEMPEEGGGD